MSPSIVHPNLTLSEGSVQVGYSGIQEWFQSFSRQFVQYGVLPEDTLWVNLQHDLAHGLLLLFLVENNLSFVAAGPGNGRPSQQCKWDVSIEDAETVSSQTRLLIERNRSFERTRKSTAEPYLCFITSGSSGHSKIAVHERSRLIKNAENCVDRFSLDSCCRIALPVPVWHMFGFGAGFLPGVMAGAAIDIQGQSNVLRFIEREQSFQPDVAYLTPAQVKSMSRVRKRPHPYKLTVVAGDILSRDTFSRYESLTGKVVQLYGSTELGAIAATGPGDDAETRSTTVGHPMSGVECRLTPASHVLMCRHPYGFAGYLNHQGGLAPASSGQWFNTHDVAEISTSGRLKILGRSDRKVNRDGTLVELDKISQSIEAMSGIEVCVCVGEGESPRGKQIIAFCVLKSSHGPNAETIRKQCFDFLPRREVPDAVVLLQELPLLQSEKVDVQRLIQHWHDRGGKAE